MFMPTITAADLYYDQDPSFRFCDQDYQVMIRPIADENQVCDIVVRKLSGPWATSETVRVLVETSAGDAEIIHLRGDPTHSDQETVIRRSGTLDGDTETVTPMPRRTWSWRDVPPLIRLSRLEFNQRFQTDLVTLPTSLIAVGIGEDRAPYYYHEGGGVGSPEFGNIEAPIHHWILVARETCGDRFRPCYMVVASTDGYLEAAPWHPERVVPKIMGEYECAGCYLPRCEPHEYPVFHSQRWVWAQSWHVSLPYVRGIPDRHYFYHNLYHPFRSFHAGIPWREKRPKVLYIGQARDSVYNFIDPNMQTLAEGRAPRAYFREKIAPIHAFVECPAGWMERREAVHYRYILDVDGAASTWDATAWKLNSGSVILKPRSVWRQWFYGKMRAGEHYMEIANDFGDLADVYKWCEDHPDACEAMVARCRRLFQDVYAYTSVVGYTQQLLWDHMEPSLIHQHVDWVVYINLDKRVDRRTRMEEQLDAFGIRYDRFSAVAHEFGIVGCTRSHLEIYKMAKLRGARNVWILEDDLEFLVSRQELETTVCDLFTQCPRFDVAMLAYKLLEHDDRFCGETAMYTRALCAQTASCYIVQAHYYDVLIRLYEEALPLLEHTRQHWLYANDQIWKLLQTTDTWVATKKRVGKQRDGYSDNAECFMSYNF
jgi:glycosyl transferase, family 25